MIPLMGLLHGAGIVSGVGAEEGDEEVEGGGGGVCCCSVEGLSKGKEAVCRASARDRTRAAYPASSLGSPGRSGQAGPWGRRGRPGPPSGGAPGPGRCTGGDEAAGEVMTSAWGGGIREGLVETVTQEGGLEEQWMGGRLTALRAPINGVLYPPLTT